MLYKSILGLTLAGLSSVALAVTDTYDYTGAMQSWVVPADVTEVTIEAFGAQGGGAYLSGPGGRQEDGGLGGMASGTLAVSAGQTLEIYVGGQAPDVGNVTPAPGGFNGGGDGGQYGAGGGGSSDVRIGGSTLADRVIVGGGGGGGNSGSPDHGEGGDGGGLTGADGVALTARIPGGGGTQVAGGAAGTNSDGHVEAGQLGLGGSSPNYHFGGGGGGYYGGGSAYAAGGGGGSSFIGGLTGGSTSTGGRSGHGTVTITYTTGVVAAGADTPMAVPSLSGWAMISLILLMLAVGARGLRRQIG